MANHELGCIVWLRKKEYRDPKGHFVIRTATVNEAGARKGVSYSYVTFIGSKVVTLLERFPAIERECDIRPRDRVIGHATQGPDIWIGSVLVPRYGEGGNPQRSELGTEDAVSLPDGYGPQPLITEAESQPGYSTVDAYKSETVSHYENRITDDLGNSRWVYPTLDDMLQAMVATDWSERILWVGRTQPDFTEADEASDMPKGIARAMRIAQDSIEKPPNYDGPPPNDYFLAGGRW